jgi:hypothetical protein
MLRVIVVTPNNRASDWAAILSAARRTASIQLGWEFFERLTLRIRRIISDAHRLQAQFRDKLTQFEPSLCFPCGNAELCIVWPTVAQTSRMTQGDMRNPAGPLVIPTQDNRTHWNWR